MISDIDKIKIQIMRWLVRREYGELELLNKLKLKGYDEGVSRKVIREYQEQGWQSDERFVRNLRQMRLRQGYGLKRIVLELQYLGIDKLLINRVMDEFPRDEQIIYLNKLLNRKGWKELTSSNVRFLLNRGFSWDQIRQVLKTKEKH